MKPAPIFVRRPESRLPGGTTVRITSREKGWPMEVKLPPGLAIGGVVLVDHIRSVDREARKMEVVGIAPPEVLDEIDARLAPLLSL